MNEDRLIDLETKFAHQDSAIEELQNVCHEQHLSLERMAKELKRLNDRIASLVDGEIGPGDQKPPHY